MASEIRVNQIQNRSGLGTVTFSDSGVVISGITTISDLRTSGTTIVAAGTTAAPSISPTGDSNTGIFFPSADTVAIAEGGVEALRVDSSGRVGINSSIPSFPLDVRGTARISSYLTMNSWINGTTDLDLYGDISSSNGLKIKQAGNVEITNGNLVFSTAGKGIDFSATANSSGTMTSELLSDYEEGTFVPTIIGGYTGVTYGNQHGWYTKVGRLVVASARVLFSGTANSSQVIMGGLPYTVGNIGGGAYGGGGIPYATLNVITNTSPYVGDSTTRVEFYTTGSGGLVVSSANAVGNWISFVVSYSTS